MVSKLLIALTLGLLVAGQAVGQNIKAHYVSKTEADGTVYHMLPSTLFESEHGDLTHDITYRTNSLKDAVINFTYTNKEAMAIDSVCFESNTLKLSGKVEKLYIAPEKKLWKHRYSFACPMRQLYGFYDSAAQPQVTIYSKGKGYIYRVKSKAWQSYAPIGNKIFEVIRINEVP